MAADFWTSSHCGRWLKNSTQDKLERAHKKDLKLFHNLEAIDHLRLHFIEYIHKLGKKLKLKQKVLATACVFFRRFYLKANFVDFDPRLVCVAVLFVGAKTEECGLSTKSFKTALDQLDGPRLPYSLDKLLECEFYVLDLLDFDLIVFHPYRPLTQYLADVNMKDCLQMGWEIVNDSYRTNLCLLYPPYMIAIAAIYMTCTFQDKSISEWLRDLNVDKQEILDITKQMLDLYDTYEKRKGRVRVDELLKRLDDHFKDKHALLTPWPLVNGDQLKGLHPSHATHHGLQGNPSHGKHKRKPQSRGPPEKRAKR